MLQEKDTISDLYAYLRDKDHEDLFVVNTSDLGSRRKRTEILFNVVDNGANVSITLHDTFLPTNIGRKVSNLGVFSRSDDFQRLVSRKFVRVIDPEAARKFMLSGEAQMELARVDSIMYGTVEGEDVLESGAIGVSGAGGRKHDPSRPNASPKVAALMLNKTLGDDQRLSALKNMRTEITREDVTFIMQETKDERIKTWLQTITPA